MTLPHATYQPNNTLRLQFPYHRGLVEALKIHIPPHGREYDPLTKAWTVALAWAGVAIQLLRGVYPDAAVIGEPGASPAPIRSTDPAYATLHLLPTAPPSVIEAAYRALARDLHPDRLPTPERATAHEAMVRVNLAYEALRDRMSA
ncbi:MAG: J domain-containing protein [Chloroflexota bacterium]|nr:J domain-containing protein [Chloroflexota bacterium]MDP9472880.1 J domain-containing protein [Chloroflexota bacterium]